MNNIVIVEDRLGRGISVAQQFEELAQQRPELDIHVLAVCYFYPYTKIEAEAEIAKIYSDDYAFEIRPVGLNDFDEVMDGYMNLRNKRAIVIMDFFLDGDGSEGIPTHRVNIRYVRRAEKYVQERTWFYTATGLRNNEILCSLFGEGHVLDVDSINGNFLRLNLEKKELMEALQANVAVY